MSMMRAVSITNPWTGVMAVGLKRIENRSTPLINPREFGKPLALHATRVIDEDAYAAIYRIAPELNGTYGIAPWSKLSRIISAVIAIATPVRLIRAVSWDSDTERYVYDPVDLEAIGDQRRWLFGRYGYVFEDAQVLATPVPSRGWQGCWTLQGDDEQKVSEQL